VERKDEFDVIHCHSDTFQWLALEEGLGKRIRNKVLTTMHGRLGEYFLLLFSLIFITVKRNNAVQI